MESKVKVAVVGAGTWGENHVRIYQSHPSAQVTAICDMNAERAAAAAGKYAIPACFSDFRRMLDEADCDVVSIATPDFAHADLAVAAAERGKDILIEKPLATTRDDVARIMDAVEKSGVRVMVDLHNRWNPPFNVAHQAVEKGELGEIYSAYFRLNDVKWVATDMLPWAARSSILWFLGSHSLDTLRWFFGDEVSRVYSVSRSGILGGMGVDTTDEYLTTLEFRHGGIAQMENGWITPNANPCVNDIKFNVLGTRGMISIDTSGNNMIREITDNRSFNPDVIVQNSIFSKPKGFAFESIRCFIDCIMDGSEFPVTVYDAANTSLAILAVMESAKTRTPVEVRYL